MLEYFIVAIGILEIELNLPVCSSLKQKRSTLLPILSRLKKKFNISVAEMRFQDKWRKTCIGCCKLSTDSVLIQKEFNSIISFIELEWPDYPIISIKTEIMV